MNPQDREYPGGIIRSGFVGFKSVGMRIGGLFAVRIRENLFNDDLPFVQYRLVIEDAVNVQSVYQTVSVECIINFFFT